MERRSGRPGRLVHMRYLALTATALLLAGCSTGPADSPATTPPPGATTSGVPSATGSATATSPVSPGGLTIPEPPGEIARSVFGANRQDVVSGDAVEGGTLEARVACTDPQRGTAWFEVLDARENPTGGMGSVMSGQFVCNGTEIGVSTTAPFSGPLQITFSQVPDTAVEGYAILSTD